MPWAGFAGAAAGLLGGAAMNIFNYREQQKARWDEKDFRRETMAREDNAVQRRVDDLVRAGLHPTLAAGSAAEAKSMTAHTVPQAQGGVLESAMSAAQAIAQIDHTDAGTKLLELEAGREEEVRRALRLENDVKEENRKVQETHWRLNLKNIEHVGLSSAAIRLDNELRVLEKRYKSGQIMQQDYKIANELLTTAIKAIELEQNERELRMYEVAGAPMTGDQLVRAGVTAANAGATPMERDHRRFRSLTEFQKEIDRLIYGHPQPRPKTERVNRGATREF